MLGFWLDSAERFDIVTNWKHSIIEYDLLEVEGEAEIKDVKNK